MIEGLKVFKVNDVDYVIGKSIQEVNNWYSMIMDEIMPEIPTEEIRDYQQTFYEELDGISEIISDLERAKDKDRFTYQKLNNTFYRVISFQDKLNEIKEYQIPFLICSSEW